MSYNPGIRVENHSRLSPPWEERPQEIRPTDPFDHPRILKSQQETIARIFSQSSIGRQSPPPPKGSTAQVSSPPRQILWTDSENQELWATVLQVKQQGGNLKRAFEVFHNTHPHRTEGAIECQYEKIRPSRRIRWTDPENQELLATVLQVQQQGGNLKRAFEAFHNTHPHRTECAINVQYAKLMQSRNIVSVSRRTPPPLLYIGENPEATGDKSGDSIPLQQSVSIALRLNDQKGWIESMIETSNAPQKRKRGEDPDDEEWGKQSSTTQTSNVQTFAPTERTRNFLHIRNPEQGENSTNSHLLPHTSWETLQECLLTNNKTHFEQILSLVELPLHVVQNIFLKECQILLQDLVNLKKSKGTSTNTPHPTVDDLQSIMEKARQQILDRIGRNSQQMVGNRHIEGNASTQTTIAKQISVHPTNIMDPQNRIVPQDVRSLYEDPNEKATEEGRTPVLSNFPPYRWIEEEKRELLSTVSQMKQQQRGAVNRASEAFHNAYPHITEIAIRRQYAKHMQNQNTYRAPSGFENWEGRHNGPSLSGRSSALLKQYRVAHDGSNLDRSETLQNSQNLTDRDRLSLRTTPSPLLYRGDNSETIRERTKSVQSIPLAWRVRNSPGAITDAASIKDAFLSGNIGREPETSSWGISGEKPPILDTPPLAPTVSSMEWELLHEMENQGDESSDSTPLQIDMGPTQSQQSVSTALSHQKRKRGDSPDDGEWRKQSSTTHTFSVRTFAPTEKPRHFLHTGNPASEQSTNSHPLTHMSWAWLQDFFLTNNEKSLERISSHLRLPLQNVQKAFLEDCQTFLQDLMNQRKSKGASTDTQNPTVDDLQSIMKKASQQTLNRIERLMPNRLCRFAKN